LAFIGSAKANKWLTTDWVLSQFGENKKLARENYKHFVLEGVGQKLDIWSSLNGQIFLGDENFVSKMQNRIEKKSEYDWSIPKKQQRPMTKTLSQIEKQSMDRNLAIVTAYSTGAYSQKEIADHFKLHPSTVGVIVRKFEKSQFGTWPHFSFSRRIWLTQYCLSRQQLYDLT